MLCAVRIAALLLFAFGIVGCGDDGPECAFDNDCKLYQRCSEGACVALGETRRDAGADAELDASDAGDADASAPDADARVDAMPALRRCIERCDADTDCRLGAMPGEDAGADPGSGLVCRGNTCTSPTAPMMCNEAECRRAASGWTVTCTPPAVGCSATGQACVRVNGQGYCARVPTAELPCTMTTGFRDLMETTVEGNPVTVCGRAQACVDGACALRCDSDGECTGNPRGGHCDTTTRECGCASDGDCAGRFGVSVCGADMTCKCASNADCVGNPSTDVCISGACGCSSVSVCARMFGGTTLMCE